MLKKLRLNKKDNWLAGRFAQVHNSHTYVCVGGCGTRQWTSQPSSGCGWLLGSRSAFVTAASATTTGTCVNQVRVFGEPSCWASAQIHAKGGQFFNCAQFPSWHFLLTKYCRIKIKLFVCLCCEGFRYKTFGFNCCCEL